MRLEYNKQPQKFLKNLERHTHRRIYDKISKLSENPVPKNSKRLSNGSFRIRVGIYRILYRISYEKEIITIMKIDKRNKIYR